MPAVKVASDIYWVGVNDRTTDLFEGIWPISETGVSYNTYLIRDEKKVIIDLVKAMKTDDFFSQIDEIMPITEIDYVVINHMEPDHTGVLRSLKKFAPNVKFLGTEKVKQLLDVYYDIRENVIVVEDGEVLDLGEKKLQFFHTPFVHWPETMMTYEPGSETLFSCDAFGGYGALRGAIFDDECKDKDFYEKESLRYYVNIVANFSAAVLRAINKLNDISITIIAPSHGLIWRKNPSRIVELYKKWAEYAKGEPEPEITLIYGSMYGNTDTMMNAVSQGISQTGIPFEIFDVARLHSSYILPSLWKRKGVIIGAPTYEGKLFPPMAQLLQMAALKQIRKRHYAFFGSYGWSGGALKNTINIVEQAKWELMDSFEFCGGTNQEKIKAGEKFGKSIAEKILNNS
jgi:flavorubredoxin